MILNAKRRTLISSVVTVLLVLPFTLLTIAGMHGASLKADLSSSLKVLTFVSVTSAGSVELTQEQTRVGRYAVPGDGFLELDVPVSWREDLSRLAETSIDVTISFRPAAGDDFLIMVTAHPVIDREKITPVALRQRLEEKALPKDRLIAEEKSLTVQELQGATGSGYLYYVTDKNLKEGERKLEDYRYVTRGVLPVRDVLLYFSIMTHEKGSSITTQALDILKKARNTTAPADRSSKDSRTQQKREERHYEVPQDGILKLNVPASWRDHIEQEQFGDKVGSVAITFLPDVGNDFAVEILAMAIRGPSSAEARRLGLESFAIGAALKCSEEKEIKPHDMQLRQGVGAYFDYTDKRVNNGERRPGMFRYVRQAYLAFDGLVVQVTIGTHDRDSFVRTEILEMLVNAVKGGT